MLKTNFDNKLLGYFTDHNDTPLLNASSRGHLEVVKYLIEKGADVNAKNKI